MTLYKWSQTAASDATADSTINWSEGQPPSSVNDSARAMMAATAKYRDDIAGAIVTGGTSTAYTVSSYQVFDGLSHLNGQMIAFTPHVTNGAGPVTLNVDSLGQKPLRPSPNTELQSGVLIQGTPYVATYSNGDGAFYLRGFYGNPFNVPLAAGMDYWASTAPNSAFAFPAGQPISRTTYAALFVLIGTAYGGGDGSTTFNLPDKTGRVSAMKEASVSRMTANGWVGNSSVLGSSGGEDAHMLLASEIPSHSHANTLIDPGHSHILGIGEAGNVASSGIVAQNDPNPQNIHADNTSLSHTATTGITINNATAGGGNAHKNIQPTIICNYIIRVL